MRYYPAALALSLLAGVWSSVGQSAQPLQPLDPRAAALLTILPLINYENRQGGILTAKALMQEGGVIACDAGRHPFPPMHPEVRAGLLDAARRLDPLVLRWGK